MIGHAANSQFGDANTSIINEELRSKIDENARLHKQVKAIMIISTSCFFSSRCLQVEAA